MTYSMSREDDLIAEHFGDFVGRFLELGSCDGKRLSNCYLLAERGWGGVCVEASHRWTDQWFFNYDKMGDRVQFVDALIGVLGPGWMHFFDCYEDDTASTAAQRLVDLGASRKNYHKIAKYGVSIKELLEQFPGPYHFISIDIDGLSLPVMREVPFDALGTKAVCIEYLHPPNSPSGVKEDAEIREFFEKQGWRHLLTNDENVIMVRA